MNVIAKPLVSIILPVYNAEKYLAVAIQSILSQTYTNFELIILNDGSTDHSKEVVFSFQDSRIRYYEHENRGLANTLNKGISLAKGVYIARQDNDDISHPERLFHQVNFLESNSEIVMLGSFAQIIDEEGNDTGRIHRHATRSENCKLDLIFDNPFVHSSVMFRKEAVQNIGAYDSSSDFFEDHNLWSRLSYDKKLANESRFLLKYREVSSGMSKTTGTYKRRVINQTVLNLRHYFPNEDLLRITQMAEFYHGENSIPEVGKELLHKVKILIDEFHVNFSSDEKNLVLKRFILKIKMNCVRKSIENADLSQLKRFTLRIRRRIIFNRFSDLILAHCF